MRRTSILFALLCAVGGTALNPEVTPVAHSEPAVSAAARAVGFIDVRSAVPDALIDLRYATANNFVGAPLYPPGARCLVHESLADGRISDRTWAACAEHLDEAGLVELVVAIGNWTLFARLLPSLEVPLEDGVEPWPPDGRTPDDPTEETG